LFIYLLRDTCDELSWAGLEAMLLKMVCGLQIPLENGGLSLWQRLQDKTRLLPG
jgi:hypothetical protein